MMQMQAPQHEVSPIDRREEALRIVAVILDHLHTVWRTLAGVYGTTGSLRFPVGRVNSDFMQQIDAARVLMQAAGGSTEAAIGTLSTALEDLEQAAEADDPVQEETEEEVRRRYL